MSRGRKANPAFIGAFVLGAVALLAVVVVVWGSGRLFRTTKLLVCYFQGSVNGLNVGAPVKFRGVPIGTVKEMRFRLAHAEARTPEEFRIPVWFEIDLAELTDLRGGRPIRIDRARLDELIGHGLRAQLQTESFVTGVLYVGLDFFPDSPVELVHADDPDVLEVPTMPTTLERASLALTNLMNRVENIDVERLVRSVTDAVDGVNGLIRSPEVNGTVVAARQALQSIRRLTDTAHPELRPLMKSVAATSMAARGSLQHLDSTLVDLRSVIDTHGPLTVELTQTLVDLGEAAQSVRELASYLERNPNAVLVGRPAS